MVFQQILEHEREGICWVREGIEEEREGEVIEKVEMIEREKRKN